MPATPTPKTTTDPRLAAFAMFVSCVPGRLVRRYGLPAREHIGVTFTPKGPVWHPEEVTALTHEEATRYRGEYSRALKEGGIVERTAEDYQAFLEADDKAAKAALAEKRAKSDEPDNSAGDPGSEVSSG